MNPMDIALNQLIQYAINSSNMCCAELPISSIALAVIVASTFQRLTLAELVGPGG